MRRLLTLMDGLPAEAPSAQPDPGDAPWGMVEELLAQLVEITSVYASERRLSEPRIVPRPGSIAVDRAAPPPTRPAALAPRDPQARTSAGLGAATADMAAWAARNGGVGGNGAALLGYPPSPVAPAKGGDG